MGGGAPADQPAQPVAVSLTTSGDETATITVKADGPCVLNSAVTRAEYDEQAGGWLAVVELPVEGDGTYELEGVQPMGVREVSATLGDGTTAVLLDRTAVEQQLAQVPSTQSYTDLGTIVVGANGDYSQPDMGQTQTGFIWSYTYKTWNGYYVQCITPTASAYYNGARDTSVWASNDAVSFYEYVASRASQADQLGVPASDPGRQAIQALASQISTTGSQTFAAEHLVMGAALQMQVSLGRNVFDTYDVETAWNDPNHTGKSIWQATCNSLAGVNYVQGQVYLQLSPYLDYNQSAVQVATTLYKLWQQYSSRGYASLMNGISAQSWIGFWGGSPAYYEGAQHIMGYSLSGRYVSDTSLTVSKESGYSNGTWSAPKKAATWRLVSVSADGAEGATYDKTLSSADGSATVTFTGVPNNTQFRLYEVKAPSGYTARERIGLYTDGAGNWVMWNQEKGAWDNSVWKATSAGKAVYTGVTGSAPSTVLHVMDAPTPPAVGKLEVYKVSAKPEVTAGNACYSLQGAKYGVYRDAACTSLVGTLTTGSDGHAASGDLTVGTYWVKETQASQGYALDSSVYKVTVEAGKTARVNGANGTVKEQPQTDPIAIVVQKVDSKTGQKVPQGSASLEGAEFTVRYYAGQYSKSNLPSKATRTWVIKTNKNGYTRLGDVYKVSGDDFYTINGTPVVPIGTLTVQETKAPAGYAINSEVFVRNIKSDGCGLEHVSVDMTFQIPETVLMGGISVQKADTETGLTAPQGKGSFKGAEFKIRNVSGAPVTVMGKVYADGADIDALPLVTDDSGYAATGAHDLPFGTYAVREVKAPEGYLVTEGEAMVTVSRDGVVVAATHA